MIRVLGLILLLFSSSYGVLKVNFSFKSFFWYTDSLNDSIKRGNYGYTQVDSVKSTETIHNQYSSLWLIYDWWHLRFKMSYMPVNVVFSKTKPTKITRCPDHFKNVEWITGIRTTAYKDSVNFYFPLLPMNQNYGRYDYFTVDVDDSLDLEFYGAGDSIMVGTFVHKKPGPSGAVNILGRNAMIVEITKANPLRIKSFRCNGKMDSLLSVFLRFPLDSLKKDAAWYGLDILDTTSVTPRIKVYSVNLSGNKPYTIGTNHDITWKMEGTGEIDSCLITIAYDKMNWTPIGKTNIDSIFNWKIPNVVTDSTILKITACGKHSERIFSIKDSLKFIPGYILKVRGLQVR